MRGMAREAKGCGAGQAQGHATAREWACRCPYDRRLRQLERRNIQRNSHRLLCVPAQALTLRLVRAAGSPEAKEQGARRHEAQCGSTGAEAEHWQRFCPAGLRSKGVLKAKGTHGFSLLSLLPSAPRGPAAAR
jgi:hypothetical protein